MNMISSVEIFLGEGEQLATVEEYEQVRARVESQLADVRAAFDRDDPEAIRSAVQLASASIADERRTKTLLELAQDVAAHRRNVLFTHRPRAAVTELGDQLGLVPLELAS